MSIDCGGSFQAWGCECPHCLPRQHPLDLIARFTPEQKAVWAAAAASITRDSSTCTSCGSSQVRLYAGGYRCDQHARMVT